MYQGSKNSEISLTSRDTQFLEYIRCGLLYGQVRFFCILVNLVNLVSLVNRINLVTLVNLENLVNLVKCKKTVLSTTNLGLPGLPTLPGLPNWKNIYLALRQASYGIYCSWKFLKICGIRINILLGGKGCVAAWIWPQIASNLKQLPFPAKHRNKNTICEKTQM